MKLGRALREGAILRAVASRFIKPLPRGLYRLEVVRHKPKKIDYMIF